MKEDTNLNKLKLAALLSLKESTISNKEKCDRLQELYADFNYPDDMSECSIYSTSQISPLEGMNNLIAKLKDKYSVCE